MIEVTSQLSLFEEAEVMGEVEKPTPIRAGNRVVEIPLRKRRREALKKLVELLRQLEGKDIYIGAHFGSHNHFWVRNLKLGRLRVENLLGNDGLPSVVVLWGNREGSVRIFTDQVVNLRQQEYQGYTLWLLDFWNGFGAYPIDPYRPRGYVSLEIVRFKD
ncbi:hypothetical protein M1N88_02175 [Dehalococcoidia bacterium]|nr:hypothetical protein [Dehalococcoidia bacterium]